MSVGELSPEELDVLAGLQAADPDAADRLAALDEASRGRVVAHLGQPVPPRQVAPILAGPRVAQPGPVVPVRSNRFGWLGWGLVSLAVVVLGVGGYTFYSRLAADDPGNGSSGSRVVVEDRTRTEPTDSPLSVSDEDRADTAEEPTQPTTGEPTDKALSPDTEFDFSTTPTLGDIDVATRGTYKAIAAGWGYSCALRTDNTITCWGNNVSGETDAPEGTYKAIAAGWGYSCALRTDDTITCWGNNDFGETDAPEGTYKAIAAGGAHSCALRTDVGRPSPQAGRIRVRYEPTTPSPAGETTT